MNLKAEPYSRTRISAAQPHGRVRSTGPGGGRRPVLLLSALLLPAWLLLLVGCAEPEEALWGSGVIEGTTTMVSARAGGEALRVAAREGDRVNRGELLVSIDPTEAELERRHAELALAVAESELDLLLEGARGEDLSEAEARVRQARAELNAAREHYHRMERLLEVGTVAQWRYEEAEVRYTAARAAHEAAELHLERLRSLARPQEIEAARSRAEQARVQLERALHRQGHSEVKSPRAARVDRLLVEPGELVTTGMALVRLVELEPVWLTVYLPQRDLAQVSIDDSAEVKVDAYPERVFSGRVVRIADEAEFTPRNVQTRDERARLVFAVKIELENRDRLLRPGMHAEAHFPAAAPQEPEER